MSQDKADISNSPGLILRTAREELKLSIEQVAHDLHLRASVVQTIEAENYDEFSSDVFLKGYFRSYCRLVNLHEERMVELLETQLKVRKQEIEDVALNAKKAEKAKLRKKFTGVGLSLAVVAGLAFYVLSYLLPESSSIQQNLVTETREGELSDQEGDQSKEKASAPVNAISSSVNDSQEIDQLPKSTSLPADGSSSKQIIDVSEAAPIPEPKNAAETIANESVTPPSSMETALSIKPVDQIEDDNSKTVDEPVYTTSSFKAVFTGDCWFKFTNAKGKTVFAALKRDGDVVNYTGPAPFSVVIGDAKQVSVIFNDKQFDLAPYTARNGRAQITLKPTS